MGRVDAVAAVLIETATVLPLAMMRNLAGVLYSHYHQVDAV
jgi:hypothetical protein